jgi:PAS domain S-box-containing protein
LDRAAAALRDGEARYRQMADSIPQLAWYANADGFITWYNRRWYEYTGTTPEQMEGWGWHAVHEPEALPAVLERWSASLASGSPFEMTFSLRGADGQFRPFLTRAAPLRNAAGEVVQWFGTNTDVADQRRVAEERERLLASERAARAEAERASQMKDEFLATLSHELRTPLNAILGWSQILRGPSTTAQDVAEGINAIERNARAQTRIIEDLLDMSRIVSGKIRLDVQRLDLADVIRAAAETVGPAAAVKGVRLQLALNSLAAPVVGDPNRLQQVFWNLLSNAIKFTPRGGRVKVLLERVNSHLQASVIDTGEGIAAEFLAQAFDRFRQADGSTTRRHGGLGLGLAIVRQLVELHGGTVCAQSPGPGRGSTFIVTLPQTAIQRDADHDAPEGERPPSVANPIPLSPAGCSDIRGARILIVDDEPDGRSVLQRLLEDCDASVITAASASEAFELVKLKRPDVMVSDIGMPGEDGYSLIRRVRALAAGDGGKTPAIALTAYARAEDRVRARATGFEHHVAKPVEPSELIATIASLIS